ncbi:unnamed protein product [Ectocarpus sp. CCAP 1310/34]|nr:unnamed protein product [Ectocarpus sp. CCAP 1310/34]
METTHDHSTSSRSQQFLVLLPGDHVQLSRYLQEEHAQWGEPGRTMFSFSDAFFGRQRCRSIELVRWSTRNLDA